MRQIAVILIAALFFGHMLAAGLQRIDLTGNSVVDLQDAIVAVRGLQNLSQSSDTTLRQSNKNFYIQLGAAVQVFRVIAGQKTLIKQQGPETTITPGSAPIAIQHYATLDFTPLISIYSPRTIQPFQPFDMGQLTPPPRLS